MPERLIYIGFFAGLLVFAFLIFIMAMAIVRGLIAAIRWLWGLF